MNNLASTRRKLQSLVRNPTLHRVIRWLFVAAVLAILVVQLTNVGWGAILRELPTTPWFYIILVVIFFLLPLAENVAYRLSWHQRYVSAIPVFVRKRVLNKEILGYSGEVYLYTWARRHLGLSFMEAFATVRDNNIISSVASTLIAVLLLAVFWYTGQIRITDWIGRPGLLHVAIGAVFVILIGVVLYRLRKYVFSMPAGTAGAVFAIHATRLIVGNGLHIVQWAVVLPDVAWYAWFTLVSVQIILTRIPFVPSRDLIFLSMSVGLASSLDVAQAAIAGMLLVSSVLNKLLGATLFGLMSTEKNLAEETDTPISAEAVQDSDEAAEPHNLVGHQGAP